MRCWKSAPASIPDAAGAAERRRPRLLFLPLPSNLRLCPLRAPPAWQNPCLQCLQCLG